GLSAVVAVSLLLPLALFAPSSSSSSPPFARVGVGALRLLLLRASSASPPAPAAFVGRRGGKGTPILLPGRRRSAPSHSGRALLGGIAGSPSVFRATAGYSGLGLGAPDAAMSTTTTAAAAAARAERVGDAPVEPGASDELPVVGGTDELPAGGGDADDDDDVALEDDEDAVASDAGVEGSRHRDDYEDVLTKFASETTPSAEDLPHGIPDAFRIVHSASLPRPGFDPSLVERTFSPEEIARLKLAPDDVTVPAALMLMFPDQFRSQTRARKECRRKRILVHRGPPTGEDGSFDRDKLIVGKVGHRVCPGDIVAIQTRMTHNYDECTKHDRDPPFALPVVYEDDHFAVVNKPEGIVVFGHKNGGFGRQTVKSCLPWALAPPEPGVLGMMRRPSPVHRIDRGTSGLLVCAKTKPAMVELCRMFKERKVKKTYTALVNGDIKEQNETAISSDAARSHGVCIEGSHTTCDAPWQIIEEPLEGQSATTIWRVLQRRSLENARKNTIALVELKPKTGRYHQLRRHMAWVSKCPLLGDKVYDGGGLAKNFREDGFYLCSNKVTLEHPYYNSPRGRQEWNAKKEHLLGERNDGKVRVTEESDGSVLIHCEIVLPAKFSDANKLDS
ncbi:hypothetical protein ACHAWF_016131, partial [Thalassiosira exigua]